MMQENGKGKQKGKEYFRVLSAAPCLDKDQTTLMEISCSVYVSLIHLSLRQLKNVHNLSLI
jgi:hypothetical protein